MRAPALAALALLVASPSHANTMPPVTAAIPYARLATLRARFNAIPPADRTDVVLDILITHADAANHTPIHLWVDDPHAGRVAIPVGPEGEAALPDRPDWAADQLDVQSDQPAHTLTVNAGFTLRIPPSLTITTAWLREALAQTQSVLRLAARQQAGYMAQFLVPTLRSVQITLPGCCTQTATITPPGTVLGQDKAGIIAVPATALATDAVISVSAPISKLDPDTK